MRERKQARMVFRYRVDRKIRGFVMSIMNWITPSSCEVSVDLRRENIKRILLVRGLSRMGDTILATPAILRLCDSFPDATIDFAGPAIAKALFQNLPVGCHYEVCQDEADHFRRPGRT